MIVDPVRCQGRQKTGVSTTFLTHHTALYRLGATLDVEAAVVAEEYEHGLADLHLVVRHGFEAVERVEERWDGLRRGDGDGDVVYEPALFDGLVGVMGVLLLRGGVWDAAVGVWDRDALDVVVHSDHVHLDFLYEDVQQAGEWAALLDAGADGKGRSNLAVELHADAGVGVQGADGGNQAGGEAKGVEGAIHEAVLQAVEGLGVVKHQDHPAVARTVVVDVVDELPDEQDILVERAAGRVSDLGVADEVLDGYVEALGDALCEDAVFRNVYLLDKTPHRRTS